MATLSPAERDYIITGLTSSPATRFDGRGLREPRGIETAYGVAQAANGSASIRIGGTEVMAGIKLEVADVPKGSTTAWRTKVEVDITPQAFPAASSSDLTKLCAAYAALLAEHFVPSIPQLAITDTKAFVPTLHLALLSADGGVAAALVLAARAAFVDLDVPTVKVVEWEGEEENKDIAGIKGAIGAGKGKGRARARGADDWDIDGGTERLKDRDQLPVCVTLNLVPGSEVTFLDATPAEEAACPSRVHVFVRPGGRIAGVRMESDEAIGEHMVRPLLEEARSVALELAQSVNADLP